MLLLLTLNLSADFVIHNSETNNHMSESEYYAKACENGDRNRCVDLGLLYITGNGVQENHKKAIELFTIACKKKNSKACYHLGGIYKRGSNGIKKRDSKAWYNLENTDNSGSNDIKKDLRKAKMFYALGCMHGHTQSCDQYNLIKDKAGATSSDIDPNRYIYYGDSIY